MAITKEQAIEILDRFDFFQGQRAGRELWHEKPYDVQERDIKDFAQNVALLREYINADEDARRRECGREVFEAIENLLGKHIIWQCCTPWKYEDYEELKKKYTEDKP